MNETPQNETVVEDALLVICDDYLENLELAPEESVVFSPELQRNMERLLRSQRKRKKILNTPHKKAVAAILAVTVFIGAAMSCRCIRETVVEFFTEVYEHFTEFFFGENDRAAASRSVDDIHIPAYIPDGYEFVEQRKSDDLVEEIRILWENERGDKIIFYQSSLSFTTTLDSEKALIRTIDSETTIKSIQKDNQTFIFWNDDSYAYTLIVSGLSEFEIVKIIKSAK